MDKIPCLSLGREREKNDAESNRGKVDSPIAQLVRALH